MLISSKENALIKEYIKLRDKSKYRRETGLFVLEGSRIAMDAVLEKLDIKVLKAYLQLQNDLTNPR